MRFMSMTSTKNLEFTKNKVKLTSNETNKKIHTEDII